MTVVSSSARPEATSPPPRPPSPVTLSVGFLLLAVFLVPLQIDNSSVRDVVDSRLAPSDIALAIAVLLNPGLLAVRRDRVVGLLPLWFVMTLSYGLFIVLVETGTATNHALVVKFVGGIVLAVMALAVATATRHGHGIRILRTFIAGAIFWGILGYLDWKVANILPFVDARIPSRFGGTLVDANNAGGLYAMVTVLLLGLGPRFFRHPGLAMLATAASGAALALSFSRGAYLAALAGGLVTLIFVGVNASRSLRLGALATVAVTALLVAGVVQDAVDDFERRPDNVQSRSELATTGIDMFTESAGLGAGLGAVREEVGLIVHNTALWLTVEMSLVGLTFFFALAALPLVALHRGRATNPRLATGLAGAHATMVVASLAIEALYQRYWWVVLGLIAGTAWSRRPADDPTKTSPPRLT